MRNRIFVNALASVGSIGIISLVLFFLYGFLLRSIGVERLGIWSLVLASTSITQIANFGLAASVVKHVAKYASLDNWTKISSVIQTAAISVAGFMGIVLLAGYPLIRWALRLVVKASMLSQALEILPYAFLTFWLMAVSSIFFAGLEGFQNIALKNVLLISGTVLQLALCLALAPRYGLRGVAIARISQDLFNFVAGWICLRRKSPMLPPLPSLWSAETFREILPYGVNYQVISFAVLCYDPLTKGLLSRFGSLSAVGYYEMANRLILQFRSLIVAANQVLVPAVAQWHEKVPEKVRSAYLTSYQVLVFISLPMFSMIAAGLPLISRIWIGREVGEFVLFGVLLTFGWFFNTLNVPAYFSNLGLGELKWNVLSHVTMAVLNLALGVSLGTRFHGRGVVAGWALSLILGSVLIYFPYHIEHRIPLAELLPRSSRWLAVLCAGGVASSFLSFRITSAWVSPPVLNIMALALFAGGLAICLWRHPLRARMVGWLLNALASGREAAPIV
jgi:O-antigen/teichoic acid export membrane protein